MIACRVIISDEALTDLQLQSSWYAEHADRDIAECYLQSFDETLADIARKPDLGRPKNLEHEKLSGLRSFGMAGAFHAHLVFYHFENDLVRIFRVMQACVTCPGVCWNRRGRSEVCYFNAARSTGSKISA